MKAVNGGGRWVQCAVLLAGMLVGGDGFAFGATGHRIVGRVAEGYLTPAARLGVADLIGPETLVDVATWADDIKSDLRWRHASPWHYVNLKDGESYATSEKNPAGDIVVKLTEVVATLRDTSAPKAARAVALKWLVHLTGDIHQPLHAGRSSDRGGNSIRVDWFGDNRNLHSVWDSGLIEAVGLSFSEYARRVDRVIPIELAPLGPPNILAWVAESVALRDQVYQEPAPGTGGSYRYVYEKRPLLERQLKQAGLRLAETLNFVFASPNDLTP